MSSPIHSSIPDCFFQEEAKDESMEPTYKVDEFVREAVALHITPFMLDSYRHEYEDLMVRLNFCPPFHILMVSCVV